MPNSEEGNEYSDSKATDRIFAQFHFTHDLSFDALRVNIQSEVEPAPDLWDLLTLREPDCPVQIRHKHKNVPRRTMARLCGITTREIL
jgi:hypothetical protein